jgi:hypothetical protein
MIRIGLFTLFMFFAGCSTAQHTWPDMSRDLVWSAMVAAANAPDYNSNDPKKRWIVIENEVDADATTSHIFINRKLSRSLKLPLQKEQKDTRDWLFTIQLLPANPPLVTFDTVYKTKELDYNAFVPARTLDEAERYFELVDLLLQKPTD